MGYAAKAMKAAHDNMYVATHWWRGAPMWKGSAGPGVPQSRAMALGRPLDLSIQAPEFVLICILFWNSF